MVITYGGGPPGGLWYVFPLPLSDHDRVSNTIKEHLRWWSILCTMSLCTRKAATLRWPSLVVSLGWILTLIWRRTISTPKQTIKNLESTWIAARGTVTHGGG